MMNRFTCPFDTAATVPRRQHRIAGVIVLVIAMLSGAVASGQPGVQQEPSAPAAATPAVRDAVEGATTDAPPASLSLSNRLITVFRATVILRTPAIRAASAERLLNDLASIPSPGAVLARPLGGGYVISVGSQDVFAIVPADLDPAEPQTLDETAGEVAGRLQVALDEAVEARTPGRVGWAGGLALLATAALFVLLRLLTRGHSALARVVKRVADRQIERLPGGDVMRASRLPELLRYIVSLGSIGVGLFLGYVWLTFVLRRFPYTRPWGEALRGFLIQRLLTFGSNILNALPDLFTVALIVLVTRLVVKILALVFRAVEQGRTAIPGVYPETAQPTRRLVTGFLWLFALALAYPYLPGSDTDAFKGVSVFVGLVISLGSSGIVNQVMSGLTLTYSRALRLGDFVRIGSVEGTVTHLGSLSTKIKTLMHEEVTIPNAVVVATQTTNYSRLAGSEGVFSPTSVTIGYDTPWRQVHALLLLAAQRTAGVRSSPPPAVWQTGLRDFYVEYTLFVCLEDQALRLPILDRLHAHIQDAFNEHGVQIMSPNYLTDPANAKIVPRERWFAEPAVPPELKGPTSST